MPAEMGIRRFWWVNQNKTHREELAGGFMWSPKQNVNGAKNQFYDNMLEVQPGDVVFSYYGTRVQGVGVVLTRAEEAPKPEFGPAAQGNNWSQDGWLVEVEYRALKEPFRSKDHIDQIRTHLPSKYSPLQKDSGDGLQSVYLAEISEGLAHLLVELADSQLPAASPLTGVDEAKEVESQEALALANLEGRTDIGEVERRQLIKARRGQGVFKANVRMNESRCRVTGITDRSHLRASHIKPWKDCDDAEKLHGCNGLLLAPHIDHLFDRGWISFTSDGDLLLAPSLAADVLSSWHISPGANVGPFSEMQSEFLEHHRKHVFRG